MMGSQLPIRGKVCIVYPCAGMGERVGVSLVFKLLLVTC